MATGGIKPPPIQPPGLQTAPLAVPPSAFKNVQTYGGSEQNLINELVFYFPREAAKVAYGGIVIAALAANQARHAVPDRQDKVNFGDIAEYRPDKAPKYDTSKAFGSPTLENMPVYGWVEFGNTDALDNSGNQYTGIDGNTYTFNNIVLPIAIITVSQPTNIIKTKITGRPGNIKEYIGADDKVITINAVVNMPTDQAPVSFLGALQRMKDAAVSIPVTNYYLNALGIRYIVIEDVTTPQEEGQYSNQALTIQAVSDIPLYNFLP